MSKEKEMTYEQASKKLEETVALMESGDVSLDECMKLYEQAYRLLNLCSELLEKCKGSIVDIHERLGTKSNNDDLFED